MHSPALYRSDCKLSLTYNVTATRSAAFADANGDGTLDLIVSRASPATGVKATALGNMLYVRNRSTFDPIEPSPVGSIDGGEGHSYGAGQLAWADFDGDGAVEEICVHLRNDEGETRRAQAFWMQFNHNHACSLVLADRVLWAISKAKEKAPFDIGAKRKTKTEGGDDSSDSEDERVKKKYKLSFDPSKFVLKPGEKPKIEKPQRITQSAEKLDTPPSGNLRLTRGSSSDTGRRSEYVQDEPEGTLQMDQEWADEFDCYVPTDVVMSRPSDLSERMEIFNKSLDLFRSAVHVGRAQFFASYSTRADWLGLHFPNGICLINMGLIKTQSQALETMAHELAHEHSNKHDIRFVQAEGLITESIFAYLLK
jgi:hypothetical protein